MEKLVPKLRFPEFEGNWKKNKIGEISNVTAGGTPNSTKSEYWNGDIPWMNSGELNKKEVSFTDNYITELGLKNSSTKIIPQHCVLIGLAGQGKTRGTAAINTIELCTNQSVASIFPNFDKFLPKFLFYNIDNRYDELRNLSTGEGGRGGLNLQIIKGILFKYPSLYEQQKIATFLTSVDERITLLEKQKQGLETYKKGVMQQLFSQQLRFKDDSGNDFPDWEEKKLGEVCDIVTGKTPDTSNSELWNGEIYFITPTDIKDENKYQLKVERKVKENSKIKPLPIGTIVYTCIASIGKIAITKFPSITNQQINSLIVNDNLLSDYLYYFLLFITPKIKATQANTTLPIINKTDFSKFKINIPCFEEQQKIASFLSAIDERIEVVSKQIEQSKVFKKGLLQQLFV